MILYQVNYFGIIIIIENKFFRLILFYDIKQYKFSLIIIKYILI